MTPHDDDTTGRLIRIEEGQVHILATLQELRVGAQKRSDQIASHDRDISLLKQAMESERKYQDLKNQSFDAKLDESARRWVDHDAQHAAQLSAIKAIEESLASAKGSGKVIMWLVGLASGVFASWLISLITRGG